MEITVWGILKIILGIWLAIGTFRFCLSTVGMIWGNIMFGVVGFILGGVIAFLSKKFLISFLPVWYITIPIGMAIGVSIDNIIRLGFGEYIKTNLLGLGEAFLDSFFFIHSSSSTSSSRNVKESDNLYERTSNFYSGRTCSSCSSWDNNSCRCTYHGGFRSSTSLSCDDYR